MTQDIQQIKDLSFKVSNIDDLLQSKLGLELIMKEQFQTYHDQLQDKWYASFDRDGDPREQNYDYGVYSDKVYPYLMVDCFTGWSRANAVNTVKFFYNIQHTPKSIVDIFAGTGQTTVILAKAFPKAKVFYHNTDQAQTDIMLELKQRFSAKNSEMTKEPVTAECVFAMEAMEHVVAPLAFAKPILSPKKCKFYIDGSSFTIDSIGHFPIYLNGNEQIKNHEYKRFFFKALKELGFYQSFDSKRFVHKRFYNGRPNVLVRAGAVPYTPMKG